MREILFRAKRIDNGEWVKGYLWRGVDHAYIIPETVGVGYDDKTHFLSAYAIEIAPQTICQFTGLYDKNHKRIWEKDIVDGHEKRGTAFRYSLVIWNECMARFDVRAMDCNFPITLDECSDDISVNGLDYQVIANAFDNPELLEVRNG